MFRTMALNGITIAALAMLAAFGAAFGAACGSSGSSSSKTAPAAQSPAKAAGGGTAASGATAAAPTAKASPATAETTSSTAKAPDLANPCSVLTQEEVSGIIGETVDTVGTPTDGHVCEYTWTDPAGRTHERTASFGTNEDLDTYDGSSEGHSDLLGMTLTKVSGIGDEAWLSVPDSLGVPFLWFRVGKLAFQTSVQDTGGQLTSDQQVTMSEQLARAAVAHLQ